MGTYKSTKNLQSGRPKDHIVSDGINPATNYNISDVSRSVIDDLTIENQKLKERLRKYEASYSPYLEEDMLFEVKIHGLPCGKKRELEETLRVFTASIDCSSKPPEGKVPSPSQDVQQHVFGDTSQPATSSTSNLRPIDSAYVFMSNSGPTPTSAVNHMKPDQRVVSQPMDLEEQKVQPSSRNIMDGLFPKCPTVMSELQKKEAVVRRLEQLFIGNKVGSADEHNRSIQQQELSKSAAYADQTSKGGLTFEGRREAHILPYEIKEDVPRCRREAEYSSNETHLPGMPFDLAVDKNPDGSFPEQRPTRLLDLDPDRPQIPSDNLRYIRHLGLSNTREDAPGGTTNSSGWIYLNLLINMAQLHFINVTPNFVRSAITDISDKFELSPDGKKIRWMGGHEGTRLSTGSHSSSVRNHSPQDDSDSTDELYRKRRRIDVGRCTSAHIDIPNPTSLLEVTNVFHHYKPLFHHPGSSSGEWTLFDESEPPFERGIGDDGGSRSEPCRVGQGNDGPIIFYRGARFYTDLSGDRGSIDAPPRVHGVGRDGYSDHAQDAVGYDAKDQTLPLSRTSSGSSFPFRPSRDCSRGTGFPDAGGSGAKIPDLLSEDPMTMEFSLKWSEDKISPDVPLQAFNASGLGGIQPADHFVMKVETRRPILDEYNQTKLSGFPASGPASGKPFHVMSNVFPDSIRESEGNNSLESIPPSLAFPNEFQSSSHVTNKFPVNVEIISTEFTQLEPSALPEPSGYYPASSDDDLDVTGSSCSEF